MRYLLDTCACIDLIRGRSGGAELRIRSLEPGDILVSTVTVAELELGVAKSADPPKNADALARFLLPVEILDFDVDAAHVYGSLRARLERDGQKIGSMDMLIAAHALSQDVTVVTSNLREFRRVSRLRVEDWR